MITKKDCVVIGAGYWGNNIIRELHKKGRLYGIIDNDKKINKEIKKKNIKILHFNELKNDVIKNCFIATPSNLHFNHSKTILNYNKNIFVEKPLVFNIKKFNEIESIAIKKKKIFMVGYLLLHHPALIELKKKIEKEKILLIKSYRKGSGKIRPKDNVLWNLAIHDLAYIFNLLNQKIKKFKIINLNLWDEKIDESKIQIQFKNKINYISEFSWINHEKEQKIIIQTNNKFYIYNELSKNILTENDYEIIQDKSKNKVIKITKKKNINFKNISALENEINFFLDKADNNVSYNNLSLTKSITECLENFSKS